MARRNLLHQIQIKFKMQSQLSLPETNPISFEINSNKTRRNCKKVHEGISIKKKPDFILYVYFLKYFTTVMFESTLPERL